MTTRFVLQLTPILIASLVAPVGATSVPTLSPDELSPGQKAEVRTVFRGHRVESFDAEIVGVLRGGRAGGDMILARATSEDVVRSGVAQGMSGSPVYVDGKLIGALSSGWSFTREPIFGITPIGEMLEVLDHPNAGPDAASAGPAGAEIGAAAPRARYRGLHWTDDALEDSPGVAPVEAAAPSLPMVLPLPLSSAGLAPGALQAAQRWLAPFHFNVVPGGRRTNAGLPADSLQPGSAVAVDLMRGDLDLSAIGTLTYRDGDRVLIFGHPFFQSGAVRLPLSEAEITTIVASDLNSFKLGAPGRTVGAALQDRRAAVAGSLGDSVHLLPIRVTVSAQDAAPRTYHYESIEDRAIAPALAAIAAFSSLLESGGGGANQTIRWRLTLYRPGDDPVVVNDITAGDSPPGNVAQGVSQPLGFLFGNPFERLQLDSVTVDMNVRPGRERLDLASAELETPRVHPGDLVRVRCRMDRWRHGEEWRDIELHVPADAAAGRYALWVGGGREYAAFAATRRPAHFQPQSMREAWRRLEELPPADALYAVLVSPVPELTTAGLDYPALPASARLLLDGGAADRAQSGATWLDEVRLAVGAQLSGQTLLRLTVEKRAP